MEIKKTNINSIDFKKDNKIEFAENKVCPKKENVETIKSPFNPSYWQSLTFSGVKKISNMSEQEKDSLVEEYAKLKCNFPKKYFRESLHYFINEKSNRISKIALDSISKMYFARFFSEEECGDRMILRSFSPWYKLDLKGMLPKLANAMKDKYGNFNKKNCVELEKILKMKNATAFLNSENLENFNLLKDENGIIDAEKINIAKNTAENIPSLSSSDIKSYVEFLSVVDIEKQEEILSKLEKLTGSKRNAIICAKDYYDNCYDDTGKEIKKNVDFVDKIAHLFKNREKLDKKLYEYLNLNDGADLLFEIAQMKNGQLTPADAYNFLELIKKCGDEKGGLSDNLKKTFFENFGNFDSGLQSCDYIKIFNTIAEKKEENAFIDTGKLKFGCDLYRTCNKVSAIKFSYRDLNECIEEASKIEGMPFVKKIAVLEALNTMLLNGNRSESDTKTINNMASRIEASICAKEFSLPVSDKNIREFQTSVLKSSPKNGELTHFEKVITSSIPKLKEMKTGLKISYPREKFLSDLTNLCDTKNKKKILSSKTEIELIEEYGSIKGYNGLILLNKLNRNDEFENEIYNLCHKFLYENEIQTGDDALDIELNKIIKAMPEFINTIGKTQHGTQKYSLDIHQLLVLANSISNPDYKKLGQKEKQIIKLSALMHDISKREKTVDDGHQNSSAVYAQNIVSKYLKNPEIKDRVYDFIKNHHWLAEYNTSFNKEEKAQQIAFRFRRPNDFEAAKIFAKADLMAVSDDFYDSYKDALSETSLVPIYKALDKFYETGNAIFSDYPIGVNKSEANKEIFNNREFKVINFHKIKENEDLSKYGFDNKKKKSDLYFLVHMLPEDNIKRCLNIFKLLSYSSNEGALSESLITLKRQTTYGKRNYGLLLSETNTNIINASNANQTSGAGKDTSNALDLIFNPKDGARGNFRMCLLNALGLYYYDISDVEFAKFYRENIANINSLSQIKDEKKYSICNKSFSGKELKNAIIKYQKENLIPKGQDSHNEIVGYAPKIKGVIAKEKSLSDVPVELLDFAYDNNLPVLLI